MTTLQKLGLIFAFNLIALLLCFGGWVFAAWGIPFEDIHPFVRVFAFMILCFALSGATILALTAIQEYERD